MAGYYEYDLFTLKCLSKDDSYSFISIFIHHTSLLLGSMLQSETKTYFITLI